MQFFYLVVVLFEAFAFWLNEPGALIFGCLLMAAGFLALGTAAGVVIALLLGSSWIVGLICGGLCSAALLLMFAGIIALAKVIS